MKRNEIEPIERQNFVQIFNFANLKDNVFWNYTLRNRNSYRTFFVKLQNPCNFTKPFIHILSSGNDATSMVFLAFSGIVAEMVLTASGLDGVFSSAECV